MGCTEEETAQEVSTVAGFTPTQEVTPTTTENLADRAFTIDSKRMAKRTNSASRRRLSSDCFEDLLSPEDLGVAFCTRVAAATHPRNNTKRFEFSKVFPVPVRVPRSPVEDKSKDALQDNASVLRCHGLLTCSPATRLGRLLKVMAVLTGAYVLAGLAVEPTCMPSEAGSALKRLQSEEWRSTAVWQVFHAVLASVYSSVVLYMRLWYHHKQEDCVNSLSDLSIPKEAASSPFSGGLWLEVLAVGGLVAEIVHLGQAPNGSVPTPAQWAMLLQLVKCWRVTVPEDPQSADQDGVMWGFARVLLSLATFAHVMSSTLLVIGVQELAWGGPSWIDNLKGSYETGCGVLYVEAWYFSVLSLTSVGYGDSLVTPTEHAVNSVFLLLSQLYTAKVCADLTWITSTYNHWEAQHQAQRAQAWVALQHMQVPRVLAERVLAFQTYVATVHREDLTQPAFEGLSENLMMELRLCAYRKLVLRAPFLREQPKDVMTFIVGALNDSVYVPGDIIVRSGDQGRELFFMRRGKAQVYTDAEPPIWGTSEPVKAYMEGDYFGELGMLTGHPRKAWIMAEVYSVCSVLPYSAVELLGQKYPGSFTSLVQAMARQYNLKSSLSWEQISQRLEVKFAFLSIEEAFAWFCSHGVTNEDELEAKPFEDALQKLKVPPLDRRILWAEIDADNSGRVTLEEFATKVSVDVEQSVQRATTRKWSCTFSRQCTQDLHSPLHGSRSFGHERTHAEDLSNIVAARSNNWLPTLAKNGEVPTVGSDIPRELLQEIRREVLENREQIRRLTGEVTSLKNAAREGDAASQSDAPLPDSFRLPSQPQHHFTLQVRTDG